MKIAGRCIAFAAMVVWGAAAFGGEVKVLDDFEEGRIRWRGEYRGSIVSEYATHGEKAFKVIFPTDAKYPGIEAAKVDFDWGGYGRLRMDVFNPQGRPVQVEIRIDDEESEGYSSRYNGEFLLVNGQTEVEIPFDALRAGTRRLDVSRIRLFKIFMTSPERETTLYFDNIRLVAGEEPAESAGRKFAAAAASEEEKKLRERAIFERNRLNALIEVASKRGLGTLEANIALITAELGLEVRPKLAWFADRKSELYDYVAESCGQAYARLQAQLDGEREVFPVPPIYNMAALEKQGASFREKRGMGPGGARRGVLVFSMLYHREGPLCEYFTPTGYFVHSHAFAGASRYDVERTPLYEAYRKHPETHRVWNEDEGWCGHIVRDTASMGGGGEPVVVCLESPYTRRAIREYIEKHAGRWSGRPEVHANILGGELFYICYCDYTLGMFREYLKGVHGSIGRLNEVWGTAHGSFDDVAVMPNGAQAGENRARWFDWQAFNCWRFVEHAKWVKGVIREIDAEMPVATGAVSYSFRPTFGRSGVDEEGLIRQVDDVVLNEAGASTIATDLLWSLSEGEKVLLDFEYHGDVAGILPHFLHGNSAMAMWWWPEEPDREFVQFNRTALPFSWEIPLADVAECLKIGLDVRRIGGEIAAFREAPAQMAILYSRASMLQVEGEFLGLSESPYTLELKSVYEGMLGLDAAVRFISSTQVREGKLAGLKVLVVPAAKYVFDDVAEAIFDFAADGGTVVVTPESFGFDEYARGRDHLKRLGIRIVGGREEKLVAGEERRDEFLQGFVRSVETGERGGSEVLVGAGELLGEATVLRGAGEAQALEIDGNAEVTGVIPGGDAGVVEVVFGKGRFYYLATALSPGSFNVMMDAVATRAGVSRPVRFAREGGKRDWRVEGRAVRSGGWLFYVTNHGEEGAVVRVDLPLEGGEVLDLRDPWREVDLDLIRVGGGRTRIFAAREGAVGK